MTGIERLNACFKAFPEETKALLHHWIPCPPGMEDHVYHRELPDGTKMVSVTGLLNATVMSDTDYMLGYVTDSGDLSREEEIRTVQRYDLVPKTRFDTGNTAPTPEDWTPPLPKDTP